ncbi:MAG: alkylmercury lyase [Luteitalea sp.]|nr:alkylmercury lyase [Luteitalea sp.]
MTDVKLPRISLEELIDSQEAQLKHLPEEFVRLFVPVVRELAHGQPVQPERLATLAGLPLDKTTAVLREAGEWDPGGTRVVGLMLTSIRTPHRFEVHGHTMWTWCSGESLMFPMLIGAPARIQSPCAATGDPIRMKVTPTSVEQLQPASAVVSVILPKVGLAELRQAACAKSELLPRRRGRLRVAGRPPQRARATRG